jgi:uncharacterized protein YdhG (YjbR/CyaY superfamily)
VFQQAGRRSTTRAYSLHHPALLAMPARPETFDAYLAALPEAPRAALERVRRIVHAAAPGVEEGFSYGLPAFRLHGRALLWMGAAARHCALYGVHDTPALAGYDVSGRGTVRFTPSAPLPEALVRTLVQDRLARIVPAAAAPPSGDLPPGIGAPARRALAAAGYTHLAQIAPLPDAALLALHGVGPKAVRLLRAALAANVAPGGDAPSA